MAHCSETVTWNNKVNKVWASVVFAMVTAGGWIGADNLQTTTLTFSKLWLHGWKVNLFQRSWRMNTCLIHTTTWACESLMTLLQTRSSCTPGGFWTLAEMLVAISQIKPEGQLNQRWLLFCLLSCQSQKSTSFGFTLTPHGAVLRILRVQASC